MGTDNITLFSIKVKLLCKSCDNFRLKNEEYLHRCICKNQAYISITITNSAAPVKVDLDVSIEKRNDSNSSDLKVTNMFNFARNLKKDEIIQNEWQFLPSSERGPAIQLGTSHYDNYNGRIYDKVYGGDYFSEKGNLTLVCKIKVRTFRSWPKLVSGKSQYPGTFAILANMFSDDNINSTGPIVDKKTDVILVVGSNKIHCHKLILGMASKVFERMFASNMKESKSQEIELKDVDLETIKSLISFIYKDEIKDEKINTDLLAAADMFEVLRLKNICSVKLAQIIDVENVARIWHCAYLHNEEDLAHLSLIFMMKKWKKLSNHTEIRELCTKYPDLMYTVSTLMAECLFDASE